MAPEVQFMTRLLKIVAVLALMLGAVAVTSGSAQARYWHHHGGYYHGWGGGFGWGYGFGYPYGYPVYAPPVYYAPPACSWVRVRVWRHGAWHYRNVRRCY